MQTSELQGAALDWAVAKCEGIEFTYENHPRHEMVNMHYSTDWSQGGPIIDREWMSVWHCGNKYWKADIGGCSSQNGPTPLIAAMRCYVASKLGDTVEIPEEVK